MKIEAHFADAGVVEVEWPDSEKSKLTQIGHGSKRARWLSRLRSVPFRRSGSPHEFALEIFETRPNVTIGALDR